MLERPHSNLVRVASHLTNSKSAMLKILVKLTFHQCKVLLVLVHVR